ncbi:hypothetical protein [Salinarimonas rosea]|uniref:hypothetical protein n=1 Tax=Salinarimonas rosea TaxID=552063 RepID=UPI000490350D|nr:hypothetical protein [Salinarimonas rosea]
MSLLVGMARAAIVAAGAGLGLVIASAIEPPGSGPYLASVDLAHDAAWPAVDALPPGAELVDEGDRRVLRAAGETPAAAAALATAAAYTLLWNARDPSPSDAAAAPLAPPPAVAPPAADLSERLDAIRTRDEASATLRRLGDADDAERLASAQGLPPAVEAAASRWVEASIAAADAQDVYGPRHPSRAAALRRLELARDRLLAAAGAAREEALAALDAARERTTRLERGAPAAPGATAAEQVVATPAAAAPSPAPALPAPPLLAPQVEASAPGAAMPWEPIGAGAGALVAYFLTALRLPGSGRARSRPRSAAAVPPAEPEIGFDVVARTTPAPLPSDAGRSARAHARASDDARRAAALAATWDRLAEALAAGERVRVLVHAEEVDAGGAPAALALAEAASASGLRVLLVDASASAGILARFDLGEDARSVGRLIDLDPVLDARAVRLPHLADRDDPRGWRAEHASCMLRLVETSFDLVVVATPDEPDAAQADMLAGEVTTLALAPGAVEPDAERAAA